MSDTSCIDVVIADDNDDYDKDNNGSRWVQVLERILIDDKEYEFSVRTAVSTVDTIRLVKESHPDVVVLDLNIPKPEDGLAALANIKELCPKAKLILVTNHPDSSVSAIGAFQHMPDAFVYKLDGGTYDKAAQKVRDEIVLAKCESKEIIIRAIEVWAEANLSPNEALFEQGGRSYTAHELIEAVQEDSDAGRSFRVAMAQLTLSKLTKHSQCAQSAQKKIEARMRAFELQLESMGNSPKA